jgi:hypothetical protein
MRYIFYADTPQDVVTVLKREIERQLDMVPVNAKSARDSMRLAERRATLNGLIELLERATVEPLAKIGLQVERVEG